jgi:hypothetical protein
MGEADRVPGGVFGRLVEPVVTAVIRRGFRADLATLKAILEVRARQAGD